jgi:AcrR family transcriptional regulator
MTQPEPPGSDQRRAGRSRNRRDEILGAASDLFAERGYRGTALAAVAERVGLTQQGLLHYFQTKEMLLAGVLRLGDGQRGTDPLGDEQPGDEQPGDEQPGDRQPGDRQPGDEAGRTPSLDQLARSVASDAARPSVARSFTVLSAESMAGDHPAHDFFVERYARLRRAAAASLHADLGDRLPAGLTAEQASVLLVAVMDGLRAQWLRQPDQIDPTALFEAFVGLLRGAADSDPRDDVDNQRFTAGDRRDADGQRLTARIGREPGTGSTTAALDDQP